ncbi:MAG: glutamate mutase L [Candidatus Phosphoribacter baldrii]|nr:glutamate mutase L [Dermatophilaceae bacterium]
MATQAATAAQTEGPSLADRRGTMLADQRGTMLVVDVGSTFTKAALVDLTVGRVSARGETPTTLDTDVMDGVRSLAIELGDSTAVDDGRILACSSAGGGLRLAVVGYERTVTAEAGYRVGLSAGAKVVHVASGALGPDELAALAHARPDIVLLVGGTDGGNAEVLQHNAVALGKCSLPRDVPIVVAGNVEAQPLVAAALTQARRPHVLADNVLPEIGVVTPESARAAIREVFLRHVIGGKGLSRDPAFARVVRAATPDAVLAGVEVLSEVLDQDVLVVDVGGATTDVYSAVTPRGEDAGLRKEVVAPLRFSRTVEADLGMRWNAEGVIEAAVREHLPAPTALRRYAARLGEHPAYLPVGPTEAGLDLDLARLAATIAVRRHARPPFPGEAPRALSDLGLVLGSGGVLRHTTADVSRALLTAVTTDHAGGWRVPRAPRLAVDAAYLLVVVGLLAASHPQAARAVSRTLAGIDG